MIKINKKRIVVGLAMNHKPNPKVLLLISRINYIICNLLGFDLMIISCSPLFVNNFTCRYVPLLDDPSLYDFSRYQRILSAPQLQDSDILFAFNDTLANGRKLNTGLYLFIFFGLLSMLYSMPKSYRMWAPVDSIQDTLWICPYFFIGNVEFLRSLNFTNWNRSKLLLSKPDRRQMARWVDKGWRRADNSTLRQKKIKYRTLLLERSLVCGEDIRKIVCKFSRFNVLRILNSINF